jgi:hypothetical protein
MRSEDLGNNRYLRFALSGIVEFPALLLAYRLLNRYALINTLNFYKAL